MNAPSLYVPPRPEIPAADLNWYRLLVTLRTNALGMWPAEAYEQDMLVNSFFGRRRMLLNHPDAIHHVLVENAANYRRSPATIRILRPIVGDGLFLSEGEEWKHQRRTIAPALAPRVMPILARHVAAAAADTIARLSAQTGEPVDLLSLMQFLALEIAGRSMFSLEMQQHGAALRRFIVGFGSRLGRPYLLDMILPASVPNLRDLARRRFRAHWLAFMDEVIDARLASPAGDTPRDLFDLLLTARDPETGTAFSRAQLRDQVATMIVAGHETTAIALFWSLYLLASAPAEQERVAAEAGAVDLSPDAAGKALAQLPYTRAVLSEALRLYPPAFIIVREAVGPDRLNGVEIPPRRLVMIAPWVLHRHRRFWDNPDAFDPGRFLRGTPPAHRFAYLPFGAGPRVCVGAQFAMAEATIVLAMLCRNFGVTLAEQDSVLPVAIVTTQPDHPARFRLRPR
ncbi:MAG TPA: cytochrome P450 [Methylomirabilota bacterium]|nr:cytochrome P450 [Methylomirabilota bacterium]